jgi:hypothetical protein
VGHPEGEPSPAPGLNQQTAIETRPVNANHLADAFRGQAATLQHLADLVSRGTRQLLTATKDVADSQLSVRAEHLAARHP